MNLKGHYAGFVSRLLAYATDIIIITVTVIFLGWLLQTVNSIFQLGFIERAKSITQFVLTGITVIVIAGIYFIFFWSLIGQTPGKLLLGLRIVNLDGGQITFWQAVRRFIGYFLSAFALYAGYLWILIDNRRQGWHDKLAGTIVIYAWDARPGSRLQAKIQRRQSENQAPDDTAGQT